MNEALPILVALAFTAIGGAVLAHLLWRRGHAAPGARPLAAFILLVGLWSVGLLIPNRLGGALMSLAPLGGAVFVHFAARLSGRCDCGGGCLIRWAYVVGATAMLAALANGAGRFIPWPGIGMLFRYDGAGLMAGFVTIGLAGFGHALLFDTWRKAEGVHRRQVTLVLTSSALGLVSVSGLGFPLIGIHIPPWPLLAQPAYIVVLAYAVLRYRLMAVNGWAVRAVGWGLLIGLAGMVSATSAGLVAEQAGAPFAWTALALLAGLGLAAPVRRLADRIIYPGGEVSAADLAHWRQDLAEADDDGDLTARAERLLTQRLGGVPLSELDQAPPGPRRVAEVMAEVVAQAKADLSRRRTFAERQRLAELGALAATIAHDIRNPMNIIAMAVADAEPGTKGEVKTQLARMEALVRDLLDYAKPWRIETLEIDLVAAIAEADRTVELDIPPELTVTANPSRLRQALVNLLDNAKAAGGRVLVMAERQPDAVMIHVCDDGPGIPDDIRASLFQPFISRSPGGTGLGLAVVAKVMAAHGGSVTLSERPGWSTCFTLR
ncbi:MAG: sensor histidine kinase, partial [Magnetospirillum sp.]|nr:sensor histidine kinase [Magnetospirillum sp.]